MSKIILFEGPDGCGKTSIAKAFVDRHAEFDYFKLKKDKLFITDMPADVIKLGHEMEAAFFTALVEQVNMNVAFDRQYPSEICYGRAFRTIDEAHWTAVDLEQSRLGTKIIICIKKVKRKDDVFDEQQVNRVETEYLRFVNETKCSVLLLDTSDEDLSEQLAKIDTFVYDVNHEK